jgi:hypothetical protein
MDLRRFTLYITRTRVGFGLLMMASPRLAFGPLYGRDEVRGPGTAVLARMMGGREVVLGAGGAIAVGERRDSANWVSMLAVADGLDAVANLVTRRLGWRARALGVLAAVSAVGHLVLAKRLSEEVDRPA